MASQDSPIHVVTVRDNDQLDTTTEEVQLTPPESAGTPKQASSEPQPPVSECKEAHSKLSKCSKKKHLAKKSKKAKKPAVTDGEDGDSSANDSTSESSAASDSDDSDLELDKEFHKKKHASKQRHDSQKVKRKTKDRKVDKKAEKKRKSKSKNNAPTSDSDSSSSSSSDDDSDSDSSPEDSPKSKQALVVKLVEELRQSRIQQESHMQRLDQLGGRVGIPPNSDNVDLDSLRYQSLGGHSGIAVDRRGSRGLPGGGSGLTVDGNSLDYLIGGGGGGGHKQAKKQKDKRSKHKADKEARLDFKRVDQVWDNSIHNYKLQDTAEGSSDTQYDGYLFHVRRTFDWEGKYKQTVIDIKSKMLRECLQDVMGNIKGVSLVEDTPKLDPNLLFLYLEDLRQHLKELKKTKITGDKHNRKKEQKRVDTKRQHLKVLIKYIDKDYDTVKNSLYPMLENGLITFDLLWALWKPNTLVYTNTYSCQDQPRVFKAEMAEKHYSIMKGEYYYIDGKYFEYDGKQFGYGGICEEIADFRGARKITSLSCYPLKYHKHQEQLRQKLVERGKKFVGLSGVHYKTHQGMAYFKKKKAVVKVNINGRIMVDPSIHRRINPNYMISHVRPKDHDILSEDEDESGGDDACCGCGDDSSDDNGDAKDSGGGGGGGGRSVKYVTKVVKDRKGRVQMISMPKFDSDDEKAEKLDEVPAKDEADPGSDKEASKPSDKIKAADNKNDAKKAVPEFTDEEYLIASPVVLGFAFAEKLWLEFTVSGIEEIQWNEHAYESLVLETKTKDIVKALVESHKYHAAESIDDVIQGKGKGLVAVLHGPPGTGKTLTAEGISELLKCPLYMVSAGELGTDSRYLETELQKILDICHAWGAILLLDEADVFLEKRNMHDIHRNALVSIFLRQLEYFQGILFLTTNRVETFDDAFQSRIHIALRYDSLDQRAKKAIFKIFIERVRVLEKVALMPFAEGDYDALSRHDLNGRQIKNTVRTAQALAVNKGEPLSMTHIRQVLEVQMSFDRDLRGGPGFQDAMRSYF